MKRKVSLKDIANELGVSTALVSYVINGKEKEGRVGKEMAQKIRETAERMNYQPNYIARSLRNRKTHSIGLIVADISNPFFANLARIIEDEANRNNYTVIIGSSDESPEKMEKLLKFLISRQVDGFIIVPTERSSPLISLLKESSIPYVLMDRSFNSIPSHCVVIDNFKASLEAVRYLLDKGYRKIGVISYRSNLSHFRDRVNGFRKGLSDAGIQSGNELIKKINFKHIEQEIRPALADLVSRQQVDAVFFITNTLAIQGLKAMFHMGINIPDDVDVMAFDSSEAYNFLRYPVPHISQPVAEMGVKAVELLLDQFSGEVGYKMNKVMLDARLELNQHLG